MESVWKQPHEPSSNLPPTNSANELLPPVTQSLQSPHSSTGNLQQSLLSSQGSQQMMTGQSYSQAPHQQNTLAQSPMRMPQSMMRPEQIPGRSPSLPQSSGSGGLNQTVNPYASFPQNQVWTSSQQQQSPQPGFPGYTTHGAQPTSSHLQQSPHQSPAVIRHSTNNPQMQPGMQYPGMPGLPQGYSTPSRGLYQSDQSTQQYISQTTPGQQNNPQGWPPQHPPAPGSWGWSNQG